MPSRIVLTLSFVGVFISGIVTTSPLPACCPAPPSGKPVVNADQTVIILWDAANRTQHFIRKASFQSEADDFGFIVPSRFRVGIRQVAPGLDGGQDSDSLHVSPFTQLRASTADGGVIEIGR